MALIGLPGTGKSLCAKVAAGMWKLPLLRLDMGAVFGGILGCRRRTSARPCRSPRSSPPCVLWIDELDKAFAGSAGDSGTSSRGLGTFLTWMQEKRSPVLVFATANDFDRLPAALVRKPRFDELFFVDLPTTHEREEILEVHLNRKGLTMVRSRYDLPAIARATEGFVGAKLEAVVNDAMFAPFMDGQREIETEDLLRAAGKMVPLAKSHHDQIERPRQLARNGVMRNASKLPATEEVKVEKVRGERLLDL